MRSRNPDGPWNPQEPVDVTPNEYERQVLDWLRESEGEPTDLKIGHLERIAGSGGEYEFDVVARFTRFGGAEFTVLVECKRYRGAVKRDLVLALHAKLRDVGAHKAMMFSASGFQKGAVSTPPKTASPCSSSGTDARFTRRGTKDRQSSRRPGWTCPASPPTA